MITKRTRTILILSILFCFGSAAVCVGLWYVISSRGDALYDRATAIAEFRAEEQAVNSLARVISESERERTQLAGYVLQKDRVPAFITELETIATEQGVVLETTNLREQEAESFAELVISLNVEGNRVALVHLYEMLETLPYHSHVSQITLARSFNAATGAATWQSTIELTVTIQE